MRRPDSRAWRKAFMFASLGVEVSGTVVAAAFIGYQLDAWLNTTPWMLLALMALGATGAAFRLIRVARWMLTHLGDKEP